MLAVAVHPGRFAASKSMRKTTTDLPRVSPNAVRGGCPQHRVLQVSREDGPDVLVMATLQGVGPRLDPRN